jgi:hypothetical protein
MLLSIHDWVLTEYNQAMIPQGGGKLVVRGHGCAA